MDWNEFLMLLHLMTVRHCIVNEADQVQQCYERVVDCVLDGETFRWCTAPQNRN